MTDEKPLSELNCFKPDFKLSQTPEEFAESNKKKSEVINQDGFIWDSSKLIQTKVFPMDIHKDKFYFGLLLPKIGDEAVGRNMVIKKQKDTPCLITSDRELIELNFGAYEKLKIKFSNIPSYLPSRWNLEKIKSYLDSKDKPVEGKQLLKKIKKQYEKYLFIRKSQWYKVYSLWDIGTYVYMIFEAYPIIENRGLAGTGKSKSMSISSLMSFNGGQIMANPSESTLFRETDEVRGSKYFDEAEKLWVFNKATKQYEGDVRTELINASYTKEAKVPRQEKEGNKFITKWYSPYSPTQLSSINGLYGATETRAITRICTKSPNTDDRGEKEPSEDRNEPIWEEIRDECYRFALDNWKGIKKIYNDFPTDCKLKRRDLQIWKPLLSIAKFISEEEYKEILDFATDLSEMRLEDLFSESSFDYMCLEALREEIISKPSEEKHKLEEIKNAYCLKNGSDDSKNDIYLNRNIGQHLKKIGFDKKREDDGTYIIASSRLFDEIVIPICPKLAISSSLSSLSTFSNTKEENKMKMNEDSIPKHEDKQNEDKTPLKNMKIKNILSSSINSDDKPLLNEDDEDKIDFLHNKPKYCGNSFNNGSQELLCGQLLGHGEYFICPECLKLPTSQTLSGRAL